VTTDDATGTEVNDDGEIEPPGGGGNVGDVAGPDLIELGRQRLVEEEVGGGEISAAIAGLRDAGAGLDGF
jgi:hypothetical protein